MVPGLVDLHRVLSDAVDALCAASAGSAASSADLLSTLTVCEGMARRLDRAMVSAVSGLERRGAG